MSAATMSGGNQIKIIWTIGRKLQLSEEELRAVLRRETGKDSMRDCTSKELERTLLALRAMQGGQNHTGDRATRKEVWKIHDLEKNLGWQDEPQRLRAFLKKYYRIEQPEWLTHAQAWRAIESLKKVLSKQG